MSKVRVKVSKSGVKELMRSEDMKKHLEELAKEKAGSWETDSIVLGTRAVASIYTEDPDRIEEELDSHRLVGGLK